jgi:hypothetical protein
MQTLSWIQFDVAQSLQPHKLIHLHPAPPKDKTGPAFFPPIKLRIAGLCRELVETVDACMSPL